MKRICFLISSISNAGGTERVCCEIANSLSANGYSVSIISMHGDKSFFDLNPSVLVKSILSIELHSKLMIPISTYKIRRILNMLKPNVLISVDSALFSYAFVASITMGITHIVWEHFNYNISLGADIRIISRKFAARFSSAVVTLTDQDVSFWKANLNCKCEILAIPNPSPFSFSTLDVSQSKPIVLSIGRLTYQKGFDRLLQIWSKISDTIKEGWELHIVGSGELNDYLIGLITALQLKHSVKIIPATYDIEAHYTEASIYCMTSRFEGFPMVLIEAQSFGLPIVSYDCQTGPSEIISQHNGVLVPDGEEDVFAKSLQDLIWNKTERLAMGKNAFANSRKYHIHSIINQWISLIERL
jgi:glycosyltransferase involved in cell wall biosynthesis